MLKKRLLTLMVASGLASGQLTSKAIAASAEFHDCRNCPVMVVVPKGTFLMGSADDADGHNSNEGPQHRVTFNRSFAVGIYDVTRAQYAAFIRATHLTVEPGCYFQGKMDPSRSWSTPGYEQTQNDPVVCVSSEDAQSYLA
jgi:formylglycine-generating enzyme required for sulfatase activity